LGNGGAAHVLTSKSSEKVQFSGELDRYDDENLYTVHLVATESTGRISISIRANAQELQLLQLENGVDG
jgi:hypothetical protein